MIIGVFGKSGDGKSYFIKNKILPILIKNKHSIYVYDINLEYKQYPVHGYIDINTMIEDIYNKEITDIVMIIEEIETVLYTLKKENKDKFLSLINYGRHKGIDIIYTAKRPKYIPKSIYATTNLFIIFRLINKDDINEFKGIIDPKEIEELKQYEYKIIKT